MSSLILSLLSISFGYEYLIPGGQFSTSSGKIYNLQSINFKERHYYESEVGCNIGCSQHCLENFNDDTLVNCIRLCGCSDLLSEQAIAENEVRYFVSNTLNAQQVEVTYPDGTKEVYTLPSNNGDEKIAIESGPNREGISFDNIGTPGVDFNLTSTEQINWGNNSTETQQQLTWTTPNPQYSGNVSLNTTETANQTVQNERITQGGYQADIYREASLTGNGNGFVADGYESFSDNQGNQAEWKGNVYGTHGPLGEHLGFSGVITTNLKQVEIEETSGGFFTVLTWCIVASIAIYAGFAIYGYIYNKHQGETREQLIPYHSI